jgi:hypothetical protein
LMNAPTKPKKEEETTEQNYFKGEITNGEH